MRADYVDFHTHLDLYPDLSQAIASCDLRRVATLTVTTTPKAYARNAELASKSEFVRVGLGLHPQLVAERYAEIDLFENLLPLCRYVGEIGLDAGPAHYRSIELQKKIFSQILCACAELGERVLSVHSVRSTKMVLDMLEENFPSDRGKVVLHWFTGSKSDIRRAVETGCYFSVNERLLSSDRGKWMLNEIPFDRVLTETDGPFIQRGGQAIEPGDVGFAVELISRITKVPLLSVRRQILQNLNRLLSKD